MAHFAQIDENNVVINVLVVPDEQETRGQEYLAADLNLGGAWIQTSYNHSIRKQYAIVGGKYDATNDVFLAPQPYPSWTLDSSFDWQPPVTYPSGDTMYAWDEDQRQWKKPE
tara:strand:- start:114 stop:449 length:336 start_codon:yes stop_codon:yes gene_type:complete